MKAKNGYMEKFKEMAQRSPELTLLLSYIDKLESRINTLEAKLQCVEDKTTWQQIQLNVHGHSAVSGDMLVKAARQAAKETGWKST